MVEGLKVAQGMVDLIKPVATRKLRKEAARVSPSNPPLSTQKQAVNMYGSSLKVCMIP